MSDIVLDQVVALALQLSISEQAKLLERVAANLAREVDEPDQSLNDDSDWTEEELEELFKPVKPKTGAEIARMIESGELGSTAQSEMINPDIDDPVEWLKALRKEIGKKRNLDWGNE